MWLKRRVSLRGSMIELPKVVFAFILLSAYPLITFLRENIFAYRTFGQVDFLAIYFAPQFALHGGEIYDHRLFADFVRMSLPDGPSWYQAPPPYYWHPASLFYFLPLSSIPVELSRLFWFGLNFVVLALCFVLLLRSWGGESGL